MPDTAAGLAYAQPVRKWLPIIVLGLTQFVMVLDGTVMNVSITTVVADLNTTVSAMQLAIATFTLTMAAFMLAGAGIGDRLGRRRTFVIGNIIYAIGSLLTALAPGFTELFLGWSIGPRDDLRQRGALRAACYG